MTNSEPSIDAARSHSITFQHVENNMTSRLLTAALLASVLVAPAFAQSSQWRASKLVGLDVYNQQNEKIGDISEVLLDKSGKVDGVVIGVGGFLGLGQRDIKVEMNRLKFMDDPPRSAERRSGDRPATTGTGDRPATGQNTARSNERKWYPDHAVLSGAGDKEQLKNMPEFKFD
jgi:sporulation protein YlmC with PRC-barrel domain